MNDIKASIVYPSGTHGSFLKLILNHIAGVKYSIPDSTTFDNVKFPEGFIFDAVHHPEKTTAPCINITVKHEDRLLYLALLLSRTAGYNIDLNNDDDVLKKLKTHIVLSFVCDNFSNNTVTRKELREVFRLTFFQDTNTITSIERHCRSDNPIFEIDLLTFYCISDLLTNCNEILKLTGVHIKDTDISSVHSLFLSKVSCKTIGVDTKRIIDKILNFEEFNIGKLNFLQEAYIDDVLVKEFGINPLYRDAYFTNSKELFETYNLKK